MASSSINQMNIVTLIREIFQTLKNLDTKYYTLDETIKTSISGIDTRLTILDTKLKEIADLQQLLLEKNKPTPNMINPALEKELQQHLKLLDTTPTKLNLNPNELTIANLLDNDYNIDDINRTLQSSEHKLEKLLF